MAAALPGAPDMQQSGGCSLTAMVGRRLQEHLASNYKTAWSTVGYPWLSGIEGVRVDAAVANTGCKPVASLLTFVRAT